MAASPNTFQYQTLYTKEYMKSNLNMPVYPILADTRFEDNLKVSDTVKRRHRTNVIFPRNMGGDGAFTTQAYKEGVQSFTISKQKEASVYVPDPDVLHTDLDAQKSIAGQLANAIWQAIDAHVLYKAYAGAGSTLDAGNFGGSAGEGLTPSVANIADIPVLANEMFVGKSVVYNNDMYFGQPGLKYEDYGGMKMWVMPPQVWTIITKYMIARPTSTGDKVVSNGYRGVFGEFNCFVSNGLVYTNRLELGANPTDGDTMTIRGVTFRFKNTLAANGDIKIGADATATAVNVAAALNALTTTTANYDAFESTDTMSDADDAELDPIAKTDYLSGFGEVIATSDTTGVDIVITGAGKVSVSETFTSGSNEFVAAKQCVQSLFAIGKNVSVALRKTPRMKAQGKSGYVGDDHVMWSAFDAHVFSDQAKALIALSVRCDATSFTAYSTMRA